MQCTKCGHTLPESAAFCPNCGERAGGGGQADGPLYQAEVKGLLKSGRLAVYRDRVEFSTSSAQRTVFNYASLVAVKKRMLPTPAILFITEDARTEACAATSKNIHEAFLYVEQAVRPYLEARRERLLAQGIRYSLLSSMGMTNSGILNVSDDQVEFLSRSGQREAVPFQAVRSAAASAAGLELSLHDGGTRSFGLDKEAREEVSAFIRQAIAPYLQARREALLAQGIYFSYPGSLGQERGTVDIRADRVDFTGAAGRTESVRFQDVRTAGLLGGMLELSLTDGTARSFTADPGEQDAILAFVKDAVDPYVKRRTVGFDTAFGSAERIEINRERGVFHILRRNGTVITDECPLESLAACRLEESTALNPMLSGIRMGSRAISGKAAEGRTDAEEEAVRSVDILLSVQDGEGQRTEAVRFGDFPLGVRRTSPKYVQAADDAAGLMDWLREACPACELILPEAPAPEEAEDPAGGAEPEAGPTEAGAAPAAESGGASGGEDDPLGLRKYIRRVSDYISTCPAPRAIAFQGSSEELRRLAASLEGRYQDNLIWLHGKQAARSELGLPMFIGASLISQLDGSGDGRGVKFAKASLNLAITLISKGSTDGQPLIDAIFKDDPRNTPEDLAKVFSELVRKRTGGERDKVIVFLDDLDHLAPGKAVELLEAMEDYLECESCVFVAAVDYATVVRGFHELHGQDTGDAFFNKVFRITFRLPASGRQLENSVRTNLERMELPAGGPEEAGLCCRLLERSVGSGKEEVGRLFDLFQLLKTLADEELYENGHKRLILFGLLCMQTRFRGAYEYLVRRRGSVTPELLSGLCRPDAAVRSGLEEGEQADFQAFAQVFCGIINADRAEGISREECDTFAQVLEFSSITSR